MGRKRLSDPKIRVTCGIKTTQLHIFNHIIKHNPDFDSWLENQLDRYYEKQTKEIKNVS